IVEDQNALNTVIPAVFWEEMREQKLVAPNAPLPINVK
ncbi:aldo/keto reductase, partial [Bacillus paranthracis]|nr:aldo/keto reductase [Bacillus paranthracis]